jgi:hypothetical protein
VAAIRVLCGYPGVEVLIPFSYVHNGFTGGGAGHDTGLGDVTVEPFLQWAPLHPHAGSVSVRLGLGATAPTGDHAPAAPVNTGQGAWQISPYLASTWRVSDP